MIVTQNPYNIILLETHKFRGYALANPYASSEHMTITKSLKKGLQHKKINPNNGKIQS